MKNLLLQDNSDSLTFCTKLLFIVGSFDGQNQTANPVLSNPPLTRRAHAPLGIYGNSDPARTAFRSFSCSRFLGFAQRLGAGVAA
jgi:hypothetical protein